MTFHLYKRLAPWELILRPSWPFYTPHYSPSISGPIPHGGMSSTIVGSDRDIDARSIVTLITFIVVNILVIFPFKIPFPRSIKLPVPFRHGTPPRLHRWNFHLNLKTAPVIGVLFLLASTCIPGKVVRDGIVGSDGVKPYDIMTLFICFAYISISLDSTGLLRYLAFLVANESSSSGSRLYAAFYSFFALTGLLIGNDPLILSGTPFLVYFTSHAKINPPTALLFTHFQVSNLVSALLVSSNPTNLVLTSAFKISFLSYSAWLALPTIAAVVVLFPVLRYWQFRSHDLIQREIDPPKTIPSEQLRDAKGGFFGATLFIITIVLLVGLSAGGKLEHWAGVWVVTLPAALAMLTWDCTHDFIVHRRNLRLFPNVKAKEANSQTATPSARVTKPGNDIPMEKLESPRHGTNDSSESPVSSGNDHSRDSAAMLADENNRLESAEDTRSAQASVAFASPSTGPSASGSTIAHQALGRSHIDEKASAGSPRREITDAEAPNVSHPLPPSPPPAMEDHDLDAEFSIFDMPGLRHFRKVFPSVTFVFSHMPWSLVPFAFSMFIMVEALQYTGWIKVFGGWWAAWAKVDQVAGSVWLMGTLSVLGCNVFGTNIGATILLSRVLQYWQATSAPVSQRTLYSAVFALAVGSNFGAYSYVFSASLAGLLWRAILRQKHRTITNLEFLRWNCVPVLVTMIVGCLVVAGEVCVIYKD